MLSNPMQSKKRTPTKKRVLVSCRPSDYAKDISLLIDQASPQKAAALETEHILNKQRRATTSQVMQACKLGMSDLSTKKKLINVFRENCSPDLNKSALSREVKISRRALNRQRKHGSKRLSQDVKTIVTSFFTSIDVAVAFPNKTNSKHPLYVLKGSAKVVFNKFKLEHPDIKISQSSFWRLRPKYVKKQSQAKLFQCTCELCENVSLLIMCISNSMLRCKMEVPDLLKKSSHTATYRCRALAAATLCHGSLHSQKCLDRQCSKCGVKVIRDLLEPWAHDNPEKLGWYKWQNQECQVNKKTVTRLTKVAQSSTRREIVNELATQLVPYGRHSFMECAQTHSYLECLKWLKKDEAAVVVDFAENYTCVKDYEPQSSYWSRRQVTIHPMVITMKLINERTMKKFFGLKL